jgi:ankyrin repeat protein
MRIDLEQARKRAKELVREGRAEKLADAQRMVARDLGYASWPRLVHAVQPPTVEHVVDAALGDWPDRALEMLEAAPELRDDPWVALCLGDTSKISDVNAPGGPRRAAPLLYVCISSVADDPIAAVRDLLARGADPNIGSGPEWTPLSAACGRHRDPELARVLLEAGASPNDNDSLYHAMEAPIECAELLFAHGAEANGTNALAHALDYDRLEPVRLLLDNGADPNELPNLHHAVKRGRSPEFLRLLVERGADLSMRDHRGKTAYAHAVRRGRLDLAEALAQVGSPTEVDPVDEVIGAVARGERPRRPVELDADARDALVDAAMEGSLEAVVAAYGTEIRGNLGGTLLHHAAWLGRPELVRRLIELGADVDSRADTQWDTPLGWCAHGSRHVGGDLDYVGVAEALVGAGARIEPQDVEMAVEPLESWLTAHSETI